MILAQIENGVIVNVAEVDADAVPDFMADWPEVVASAGIGWTWDGSTFEPPAESPDPVPEEVSRYQARMALLDVGLLADVELAVSGADVGVQMAWAEAGVWRRDSPTIAGIASMLGLTENQLDDLFRAAAQITA